MHIKKKKNETKKAGFKKYLSEKIKFTAKNAEIENIKFYKEKTKKIANKIIIGFKVNGETDEEMKISSITSNTYNNTIVRGKRERAVSNPIGTQERRADTKVLPGYNSAISFTGGMSLDLSETKKQLDLNSQYPPGIREMIEKTLAAGNPEKKTLIDIHKDKYALLNECETLREVKKLYPEFAGVNSDEDIVYFKNGFISEVKNGEVKGFDPDKDVALQLLQLYWGEGFSLPTLKEGYAGRNIRSSFERLNIPLFDRVYARYLKLSDKNYNERYSRTIAQKNRECARKRREAENGVHTPRCHLSDEHKEKISKGLKRYYLTNPDRIYNMPEEQRRYFESNPDENARLSEVLIRAWGYPEVKPIRKAMARMMQKDALTDEDIQKSLCKNTKENLAFRDFWRRNEWAKEKFSVCMKKSLEHQDKLTEAGLLYDPAYKAELLPKGLKDIIAKDDEVRRGMSDIAKNIGCTFADIREKKKGPYGPWVVENSEELKANKIAKDYLLTHPGLLKKTASSYFLAILYAFDYMKDDSHGSRELLRETYKEIHNKRRTEFESKFKTAIEGQPVPDDTREIYFDIMYACITTGDIKSARKLDEFINLGYEKIKDMSPGEASLYCEKVQREMSMKRK